MSTIHPTLENYRQHTCVCACVSRQMYSCRRHLIPIRIPPEIKSKLKLIVDEKSEYGGIINDNLFFNLLPSGDEMIYREEKSGFGFDKYYYRLPISYGEKFWIKNKENLKFNIIQCLPYYNNYIIRSIIEHCTILYSVFVSNKRYDEDDCYTKHVVECIQNCIVVQDILREIAFRSGIYGTYWSVFDPFCKKHPLVDPKYSIINKSAEEIKLLFKESAIKIVRWYLNKKYSPDSFLNSEYGKLAIERFEK